MKIILIIDNCGDDMIELRKGIERDLIIRMGCWTSGYVEYCDMDKRLIKFCWRVTERRD